MYLWNRETESIREFKVIDKKANKLIVELTDSVVGKRTIINMNTDLYARNRYDLLKLVETDLQRQLRKVYMMKDGL